MNDDTRRHLERIYDGQRRRLFALEEQAAKFGYSTPAHITIEIAEITAEIQHIKAQLDHMELPVSDRPGTAESGEPRLPSKRELRDLLIETFNRVGLASLCVDIEEDLRRDGHDLRVNLDMIGGNDLLDTVLRLIEYLYLPGYGCYLVAAIRRKRPGKYSSVSG
jgi:hypothetical protein